MSFARGLVLAAALALVPQASRACEVALLLAIDVSGSVDPVEYGFQTGGLAEALGDPAVAEALVAAGAAVAVVEWSGAGQQRVVLPWARMRDPGQVGLLRAQVGGLVRSWDGSDTAVGEAIAFAAQQFARVADCGRRVIDISGDGDQNAGTPLAPARSAALAAGIEINAVAIEGIGLAVTEFYRRRVISPKGFVLTARGHTDYPRAIRAKILREVERPAM